ncbi:unnamed protein product [Paramecium sonneborni]|uniref:Uncharacterized protein n=1 Tax=Paramecium sonneborni TaxID=65129 RepID=A0A8S1LL44_9CILI|nr:unnamed protein product [Paramecium sonneborni]
MSEQLYQGTWKHNITIEIDLTQIKGIEIIIHMRSKSNHLTLPKHITQNHKISKEPSKYFNPKFLRS